MFYPIKDTSLTLTEGDTVAARCTMVNHRDRITYIGSTNEDEMCNFYIMYWVEGNGPMKKNTCFTPVTANIKMKGSIINDIYLFRVRQHGLGEAGISWEVVLTIFRTKKHLHYNLLTNWLYLTLIFLGFIHSVSKKP